MFCGARLRVITVINHWQVKGILNPVVESLATCWGHQATPECRSNTTSSRRYELKTRRSPISRIVSQLCPLLDLKFGGTYQEFDAICRCPKCYHQKQKIYEFEDDGGILKAIVPFLWGLQSIDVGITHVTVYTCLIRIPNILSFHLRVHQNQKEEKNRMNDQDSDIEFPPTSFQGNVRIVKCPVHDYSASPSHVYTI